MDKDSVIIKYLQNEVKDLSDETDTLRSQNDEIEASINEAESRLDEIYAILKMEKSKVQSSKKPNRKFEARPIEGSSSSYDDLYEIAASDLSKRGLDVETLDYHDLVSPSELVEIETILNRPLPRKEKWTKADYIAVFIAGSIGSLVDFIFSDRNNKFTGKGSEFSDWLNKFHEHEGGGPIDYQGIGFGGGYHRGLSKGHDVLRFIEAIIMFKNGRFEGMRYIDGVGHKVVSSVNQYGTAYEQLGWIEAILKYAKHMFADLFSTCSLPFPGSSFLVESSNRDLRKLAATMYQNGFNMKNIMVQSLSAIIVEVILRVYFGIQSVKSYKSEFELSDCYSNFSAIKEFIKPSSKDKLHEMLLLSHSIVMAVNVGKVIIKKAPWELNVTEIISVIRYAVPVVNSWIDRNSGHSKDMRNAGEIHERWAQLLDETSLDRIDFEFIDHALVIG